MTTQQYNARRLPLRTVLGYVGAYVPGYHHYATTTRLRLRISRVARNHCIATRFGRDGSLWLEGRYTFEGKADSVWLDASQWTMPKLMIWLGY